MMSSVLRWPVLLFSFLVEMVRRVPGARFVARLMPWVARVSVAAAIILVLLWGAEASPERISLADLQAGKLSHMQSWIIVSGDLADATPPNSTERMYRLTDQAAPNAFLDVRSPVALTLGATTVSGRIEGGRDGVPPGYTWSARLNGDEVLASELPPPPAAYVLLGLAVVITLARRTSYPMFVSNVPAPVPPARGGLRVVAHGVLGPSGEPDPTGTLEQVGGPGTAELRIAGLRPIAIRLHSAFTASSVGVLRRLRSSEPALHVRAADDDLTLGFASSRDRDAAYAALAAGAQVVGGRT